MDNSKTLLTQSGFKKLQDELEHLKVNRRKEIAEKIKDQDELEHLKVNRRKEIAEKIKEARAQGDLSENAEYDAAKDEQRDIEARIEEIEAILKNADVVEETLDDDRVNIGCRVTILDIEFDEEMVFDLVV